MSGGVDSSVVAALLAEAGCEVVGIAMKLWNWPEVGGNLQHDRRCCSADAFAAARLVARRMDFPFYVIDLAEEFRRAVIDDFINEYRSGKTPNPCVQCNTRIKWSTLEARAQELGADFLATGHYARIERNGPEGSSRLLSGVDTSRDQSYFLWGVSRISLARTIFPLGELTKHDVRALARELGLPNADRPESREICFVADDDYGRFLREHGGVSDSPGDVVGSGGQIVGRHEGIVFYTIGQRKGVGAHGRPVYVTALDPQTNTVHIGGDDDLLHREFEVEDAHWISIDPPSQSLAARVKIRYRHTPAAAEIFPEDGKLRIAFSEAQRAITPGQSAVFYDGDIVLGGGRIVRVMV